MQTAGFLPHPEHKILIERFQGVEYGTAIPHEEIEELIGIKRDNIRYYNTVTKWKREMLERFSRRVECVHDKGYRVIEPGEHLEASRHQLKLARRRVREARTVLECAPIDRLTPTEGARLADNLARIGALEALAGRTIRENRIAAPKDLLRLEGAK